MSNQPLSDITLLLEEIYRGGEFALNHSEIRRYHLIHTQERIKRAMKYVQETMS